jgi:hypothetical protein
LPRSRRLKQNQHDKSSASGQDIHWPSLIFLFSKGESMAQQPMFVITKSGLIIRPEKLKLLSSYTRHFIRNSQEQLTYLHEEGGDDSDTEVVDMRREVARSQEALQELEQLTTEVERIYELNFVREATIVRETLHALGFTKIEEVYILSVLVDIMLAHFKAENPTCNEEKFRKFINNETEDPIMKQARRVSA